MSVLETFKLGEALKEDGVREESCKKIVQIMSFNGMVQCRLKQATSDVCSPSKRKARNALSERLKYGMLLNRNAACDLEMWEYKKKRG